MGAGVRLTLELATLTFSADAGPCASHPGGLLKPDSVRKGVYRDGFENRLATAVPRTGACSGGVRRSTSVESWIKRVIVLSQYIFSCRADLRWPGRICVDLEGFALVVDLHAVGPLGRVLHSQDNNILEPHGP